MSNNSRLKQMKLTEDCVFIDGGAHKGQELKYLTKVGCEVHSFEVNPAWIETLNEEYSQFENVTINQWTKKFTY